MCLPVVAPQVEAPGKPVPPKGAGAPHVEPAAGKFAGLDPTPGLVRIVFLGSHLHIPSGSAKSEGPWKLALDGVGNCPGAVAPGKD
jgi:hypothetical protein